MYASNWQTCRSVKVMQKPRTALLTLESFVASHGPVHLDHALELSLRILSILEYCHERNMIHSHLRPDKIVMDGSQPLLIDFSFPINGSANGSANGSLNGNFLELPEYQLNLHTVERNEQICDVTAVAGLFFYALTGEAPGPLRDREGRMPHQRPAARSRLLGLSGEKLFLLNQIFDKAFQWQLKDRFASARDLADELNRLKNYNKPSLSQESLDELLKAMRSNNQSQTVTPHEMRLQTAFNGLQVVFGVLASALESDLREMEAGYRKEILRPVYNTFVRFNYKLAPEARLTMRFKLEIVGSEIVVTAYVSQEGVQERIEELFRTEHHTFYDSTQLEKTIRAFVAQNLALLISQSGVYS